MCAIEILYSSVKHVEMQRNQLRSVEEDTFQGLRLENLKLADNQIHTMARHSLM